MTRQRIVRPSARVIVVDDEWRVLLIEVVDPSSSRHHWIVPGGGIEAGETIAEAAARELAEESGLLLTPEELGAPIAQNSGEWEFLDKLYYSDNVYFLARVPNFDVNLGGLTLEELKVHSDWRWWTLDELDSTTLSVVPPGLANAVRKIRSYGPPQEPLQLPFEV